MIVIAVLGATCSGAGQTPTPKVLVQAMHCIKYGDREWLTPPLSERKQLQAGFIRDASSRPGEEHFIILVYRDRASGQVFDLTRTNTRLKTTFAIQNNGGFVLKNGELDFTDPPLGGVWTQQNLEANAKRVWRGPKYSIDTASLKKVAAIGCTSYAAK